MTQVSEVMTHGVRTLSPQDTMQRAARTMSDLNVGALPVCDGEKLVGMVTDRDITIRAIAAGKGPDTPVREVLSHQILYCFEDQELAHVAKTMGVAKIRRLPVLSRDKRLVGMLSLADVARHDAETASAALADICRRGG